MSVQRVDSAGPQQETLTRLLAALRGDHPEEQLAALGELSGLSYSSQAILAAIEQLSLRSADPGIRAAAQASLRSRVHRYVYSQLSDIGARDRRVVLRQIECLHEEGILSADEVSVLQARYGFDIGPGTLRIETAAPVQIPSPAAPAPSPAAVPPPKPDLPPAPRPTLTQTLLSETSIRIALYLGAFLVIAAAAILAALVEAARLPILGAVTLAFAAGAAITRRRLPQPSFVLFIVFSCLLPFDAAVLRESLGLRNQAAAFYWGSACLLLSAVWILGTRFFSSRFFSVAAFVAFEVALFWFLDTAEPSGFEGAGLAYAFAGLVGLGGVYGVQRWKDARFAAPLFGATLLATGILILLLMGTVAQESLSHPSVSYWLVTSPTVILIAGYFFISDLIYPAASLPDTSPRFSWLGFLALAPLPFPLLKGLGASTAALIVGIGAWGAIYALASESIRTSGRWKLRSFYPPLIIGAYLLLAIAWLWSDFESANLEFGIALLIAATFGVLAMRKPPRLLPWVTALLGAVAAFILFFRLPLMDRLDAPLEYSIAAAAFLLFLPDFWLYPSLGKDPILRWPLRVFAILLAAVTAFFLATGGFLQAGHRAAVWALFAIIALGYSLRYKERWMPYIFALLAPLAVLEALAQVHSNLWLPAMIALAVAYYAAGFLRGGILAAPLRYSGLALSSLAVAARVLGFVSPSLGEIDLGAPVGWYSLLVTLLFAVELYRFRVGWAEMGINVFASVAWLGLAGTVRLDALAYRLTGLVVLWIALPLAIEQTLPRTRWLRASTDAATAGLSFMAAASSLMVLPGISAINLSVLAAVFLATARIRQSPRLVYAFAASLTGALAFTLSLLEQSRWLFPMIALAILFYAVGFALRRRGKIMASLADWDQPFLHCGLGLAALLSLSAPLEDSGLQAAIPVALAAVLWTIEAFTRRDVRLGFPSNGLYLLAYYVLLSALNVNEPQFYSVAAAGLGLLMHYLLVRSGSHTAAFITGMVSQMVLLSTTYIQMLSTERLGFFAVLFFQGLVVLAYGIVIRSRSLVIAPIAFVVLGVMTVLYSALKGISIVVLIGTTGIILLLLGILAVSMRDRITRISERISAWQA